MAARQVYFSLTLAFTFSLTFETPETTQQEQRASQRPWPSTSKPPFTLFVVVALLLLFPFIVVAFIFFIQVSFTVAFTFAVAVSLSAVKLPSLSSWALFKESPWLFFAQEFQSRRAGANRPRCTSTLFDACCASSIFLGDVMEACECNQLLLWIGLQLQQQLWPKRHGLADSEFRRTCCGQL